VLVPEMNTGQLAKVLRAKFLVDVESYTKVQGQPLFSSELEEQIIERQS
jgi:2-oxoglutarate/2-oxoacid ferredoxin oxidoreductase subunit alpha